MNNHLPETGYIRLPQIIGDRKANPPIPAVIPISRSKWWDGIRRGIFPKPSKKFGPRIAAWDVKDIRALLEREG
jgi:predicted DNA-binding transcriptional regulator AlpA